MHKADLLAWLCDGSSKTGQSHEPAFVAEQMPVESLRRDFRFDDFVAGEAQILESRLSDEFDGELDLSPRPQLAEI